MISNFCNSFRVLPLCNALVKPSFTTVCQLQLRDIHLHQPTLKSIEEKLGLPVKPKQPSNPYFRFLAEVRPTLQQKNPKLKPSELVTLIAKMWKSLHDTKKERFTKGYKEELASFAEMSAKYRDNLSEEDVRKIKETRFEQKERKTLLTQKKKCLDLGKPRKPVTSFVRYMMKQPKDRQPKETYQEYMKRLSVKWQSLADAEKEKYKTPIQDEENYRKELVRWEAKMRKLGHFDIVSSEPNPPVEISKPRRTRTSSDE